MEDICNWYLREGGEVSRKVCVFTSVVPQILHIHVASKPFFYGSASPEDFFLLASTWEGLKKNMSQHPYLKINMYIPMSFLVYNKIESQKLNTQYSKFNNNYVEWDKIEDVAMSHPTKMYILVSTCLYGCARANLSAQPNNTQQTRR